MPVLLRKARILARLVAGGQLGTIRKTLAVHLRSERVWYGLRRDLSVPHSAPPAKQPVKVRPATRKDVAKLLSAVEPELDTRGELDRRRAMLRRGPPTCFVAVDAAEAPCYMQWLFTAAQNDLLREAYGELFPRLGADEALLENAFTFSWCRSQGIMSHAMTLIAAAAGERGARWVYTYVRHDNRVSLKGCVRAGFAPYSQRIEHWTAFRRSILHRRLSEAEQASLLAQLDSPARAAG